MILSDLDIKILVEFIEKGITTTWEMAKKFSWEDKPRGFGKGSLGGRKQTENYFYIKKNLVIKNRIRRMIEDGIISIEKDEDKKDTFILDDSRTRVTKHKFPNGMHKALFLQDSEGKWIIFQI